MKRLILSAALLVLAAGCNNGNTQPPEQGNKAAMPTTAPAATEASAAQKPINKYCAVNRDEEVDPTVTTVYQGKVIGFCCEDCIPKFKQDPEKYMKGLK